MITLYHGSNVEIYDIDLSLRKNGKDFGKGFYLNPNFEQARGMVKVPSMYSLSLKMKLKPAKWHKIYG